MAIQYIRSGGSTSTTYSFDCSNSDILFVSVSGYKNSGDATVTYGGVQMTMITSTRVTNSVYTSLFYLISPKNGSNNIVVSNGGGSSIAICYSGAKQSGQPDNFTSANGSGTGVHGLTLTTVDDNCWSIFTGYDSSNTTYTNATERQHIAGGYFLGDSNGVIYPAGNITQSINMTGSNFAIIQCSFSPTITGSSKFFQLF